MTVNKNMMVLMLLALFILGVAIFVATTSFHFQFTGVIDTIVGHCVGSACNSV